MEPKSLRNFWRLRVISAPEAWALPGGNRGEGVTVGVIGGDYENANRVRPMPTGVHCDAIDIEEWPNNGFGSGIVNARDALQSLIEQEPTVPLPVTLKPYPCIREGYFGIVTSADKAAYS